MRGFVRLLALRNLRTDWFGTLCAILGVALGTATVNVVLVLDLNTRSVEARRWSTNPDLPVDLAQTVRLKGILQSGQEARAADAKEETHEDYQVMRSAIRLGSLSAFLVGALIVFFTFRVVVEEKRREIALLRSLGATARQVGTVFLLESGLVGLVGAALGLIATPPLAVLAAILGITTTGRSTISWVYFPWEAMLVVALVGAGTAVLGVLRPLWEVLRLDVPRTLRPQFMREASRQARPGSSHVALIAVPFMVLLYVLIRPFFLEVLPSLAFFVLEAGLVCAGFLSVLVLIPEVVRVLGGRVGLLLPRGPAAERLLTLRRVERQGHELSWAVSGVMLVFALVLALHVVTHALKREVVAWAGSSIRGHAYLYARGDYAVPEELLPPLPPQVIRGRFSGRTPWPNSVYAARTSDLRALAQGTGEETRAAAARFGAGKVILSTMMARRFNLGPGDFLEVESTARSARLEVVGVTDEVGYVPVVGPYRNSKTYALIAEEDFDLIAPYAPQLGAGLVLMDPRYRAGQPPPPWREWLQGVKRSRRYRLEIGAEYERDRVRETDRDFLIFDAILALTGLLAIIGIANNLVLSAHARRREIALYRVLGMKLAQVRRLFLMEGAFIGLLGGALAVVLGIPLGWAAIGALQVVSAFEVHFQLPPLYALYTVLGAVLVSLAAALYPARKATRLSGAESIHYE